MLLVSASEKFNASAMTLLPATDYWPVTAVSSVSEARRRLVNTAFDLILINAPLPDEMGAEFAAEVCRESDAAVLLLIRSELYDDTYYRLLPSGAVKVDGDFRRGDTVDIADAKGKVFARGLVNFDADECRKILGCKSGKLHEVLGADADEELVHRDNLLLLL